MALPSPAPADVFMSYNSQDIAAVESVAAALERAGVSTFLDHWHLVPGEPWQEKLERALDLCAACAVMIGAYGVGPWQNEEIRSAIEDRVRRSDYRVIPVFLPGTEPALDKLPRFLRRYTACQLRSLDDEEVIRRLVAGVRGEQPGPAAGRSAPVRPGRVRAQLGVERVTWRRSTVIDAVRRSYALAPLPIVLHGLTGMGKTVAACDIAEELFDDGRELLVIPMAQPSAAGVPMFIDRVGDFLTSGGRSSDPVGAAARPLSELLQSLLDELAELRLLMILDGAVVTPGSWESQVCQRLAAAPDIALLVTSQRRPELGTPTHSISVPPLSRAESLEFIAHYRDLLGLAVDPSTLADRLGPAVLSSPIALRALLSSAQWTPTSLLAVDAVGTDVGLVTRLIGELSNEDRRALAFADVITGTPLGLIRQTRVALPPGFEQSVRTLVGCCLAHTTGDTVDVPDLVVESLRRGFPDDRAEAVAGVADGLLASSRDDRCPADVLAPVYTSVTARWAAGDDWRPVEQVCHEPLLERLNLRGRWREYLLLLRLRVDAADHIGSTTERIDLRFRLVRKLAQTRDLPAAWETLRAARDIIAASAPERHAEFLSHRGFLNHLERNDGAALEDLRSSLRLHEASGNAGGVLIVKKLLGNVYLAQHRYRQAAKLYEEALALATTSDAKQRLEIEASLAVCELHIGGPEVAEQRLHRVAAEMRSWGFHSELARVLLNLTVVLEKQGRRAEARQTAAEGARIAVPDTSVAYVLDGMVDRLSRQGGV